MRFSEEFTRRALAWVGRACLSALLLLPLVVALACGGDGNVREDPIAGAGASPAFGTVPQPASEDQEGNNGLGIEPGGVRDNPSIVNHAVGDGSPPGGASAAADPGGSLVTEPGVAPPVSQEPTRTWATMPGIDPAPTGELTGNPNAVRPDAAPEERPSDARQAPGDDMPELTRANADFAFDLYRELSASGGNLFFSPHSISTSLAMTYAGARGDTETAMADTLRFSLPPERLHRAFDALGRDLSDRSAGDEKARFRLNAVNAVWVQDGHPFRDSYLELVENRYDAEVRLADFSGNPEGSRSQINRWVSDKTEEKIEDLIPPGLIDGLTRMVLVNAVYFNAGWLHPFDEHQTTEDLFRLLDGGTVNVDMMRAADDVVHKAFVSVDEAGTRAAAATGVVMQTESAKPRPVAVRVDRPFIFLIRDHATAANLFVGRVTQP